MPFCVIWRQNCRFATPGNLMYSRPVIKTEMIETKERMKEETSKDAIAIGSRRKDRRWRNGATIRSALSS